LDVQIFTRNIELNSEAGRYIQKKFSRLERHLRYNTDAKLEVSKTSNRSQADRVVAQLTIRAGGATLRAEESSLNLFAAIDTVADVMDRQIQRYKGKAYRSAQGKKAARTQLARETAPTIVEEPVEELDGAVIEEFGKVVRTKRFPMKPMTVEEAIMEMELLDHDFFLFNNTETGSYNVVYRRQDGDYGVIQPAKP
jgi:putative sigma-54 modulation protein